MKRVLFSEEAKADIRAIPQHLALNILHAIHRFAESGVGPVKQLQDSHGEKRLRVGGYRVRFSDDTPDTLRILTVKNRKDACR